MIDELSVKVTDFFYDYDPCEFKDNYNTYDNGLEDAYQILSSKEETKNLIFNIKSINDDLYGDEDKTIKELFDRSASLIEELKKYEKSLEEDYEL